MGALLCLVNPASAMDSGMMNPLDDNTMTWKQVPTYKRLLMKQKRYYDVIGQQLHNKGLSDILSDFIEGPTCNPQPTGIRTDYKKLLACLTRRRLNDSGKRRRLIDRLHISERRGRAC